MRFYLRDYLAKTRDHSAQEHGAHFLLLASLWIHGGAVRDDRSGLCKMLAIRSRDYQKIRESVIERHFVVDNGMITNRRLTEELHEATKQYEQRVSAGKKVVLFASARLLV